MEPNPGLPCSGRAARGRLQRGVSGESALATRTGFTRVDESGRVSLAIGAACMGTPSVPGGLAAGSSGSLVAAASATFSRVVGGGGGGIKSPQSNGLFCRFAYKSPHLRSTRFVSETVWEKKCGHGSQEQTKFPALSGRGLAVCLLFS